MAVEIVAHPESDVIEADVSGRLSDEDYKQFVPELEKFLEAHGGKASLLFNMRDFHGWDLAGMWQDFRFGVKHRHSFPRIAMVGEKNWEKWTAGLCRHFLDSEVRYFDQAQLTDARQWLGGQIQ